MFSPRWRKIFRDLLSNKTRTFLVILSIAVGVFSVGMIVSSRLILSEDLSTLFAQTNPPQATIYGNFDEEVVESVRRMPNVEDAQGRGSVSVKLFTDTDQTESYEIRLAALPSYEELRIGQILPISGSWPPNDHEFLIEQASLRVEGLEVGDTVLIEQSDGTQREMRISGVVHDLAAPSMMFDSTIKGYINFDTYEWLSNSRSITQLHIIAKGPPKTIDDVHIVAEAVREKLEKGGESVRRVRVRPLGKHWADEVVNSMMLILAAMGFLSLVLSGFLVINTISALLAQQIRQIGVMKTLGAQTSQLVYMYLVTVLIFGTLSLLLAIPLGGWASYNFVNFIGQLLNFYHIEFRIPFEAFLLEIAVGLLVPLLAALWPIISGARLSIYDAINSNAVAGGEFGSSLFDQMLQKITGLPRPLLLSLRNTFRRKARLALTLSTLVLGGAIFIAVLTVHASLMSTLDDALGYWNYDLDVNLNRSYRIDYMMSEALKVPGVVAAESWIGRGANRIREDESESDDLFILAPPAETEMIQPNLLKGRWLLPEDENALVVNSIVLDEESDIDIGHEIELSIDGRKSTWQVVGIVQGVMTGPTVYANYPYFAREIGFVGRANSLQIVTELHTPAYHKQIATRLTDYFESQGLSVSSTESTSEEREQITYQFNLIVAFLSVMAILIAIVGALGLAGTMSINVLERSREIGVMRAIGASDGSVLQIFLVEGILIGSFSWFIGGILSLPISKLLSDVVGVSFVDAPLNYTFSTNGALLWLVVVIILAALSSWWPSWRASRLTVRDVLAYE